MVRPVQSTYRETCPARGVRLTRVMQDRGLDFNCQLAYQIGVAESTISRWRAGKPISLNHAVALCEALAISLDYLFLGRHTDEMFDAFGADLRELSASYWALDNEERKLCLDLLRSLRFKLTREDTSEQLPRRRDPQPAVTVQRAFVD